LNESVECEKERGSTLVLVSRIESEAECEGTEESNEDDAIFLL